MSKTKMARIGVRGISILNSLTDSVLVESLGIYDVYDHRVWSNAFSSTLGRVAYIKAVFEHHWRHPNTPRMVGVPIESSHRTTGGMAIWDMACFADFPWLSGVSTAD